MAAIQQYKVQYKDVQSAIVAGYSVFGNFVFWVEHLVEMLAS